MIGTAATAVETAEFVDFFEQHRDEVLTRCEQRTSRQTVTIERFKPYELIVDALARSTPEAVADEFVPRIRTLEYSATDFLHDVIAVRDCCDEILQNIPRASPNYVLALTRQITTNSFALLEHVLRRTVYFYELVTERGRHGYCQLDGAGTIEHANVEFRRLIARDDVAGLSFESLFSESDREFIRSAISGSISPLPEVRQLCLMRPDAELTVLAEIQPMKLEALPTSAAVTIVDVSSAASRYREVLDRAPPGMAAIEIDLQGRVDYANPAALEMLLEPTWRGLDFNDFLDQSQREILLKELRERGEGQSNRYRLTITRRSDGRQLPIEITGIPRTDGKGKPVGSIGFVRSLAVQACVQAIHRQIECNTEPDRLLEAVAKEIEPQFPFDLFIVTRYSGDTELANPSFQYPLGQMRWDKKWMPLPERTRDFVRSDRIIDDLPAWLRNEGSDFAEEKAAIDLVKLGYRSCLRVPIKEGNRLNASVTLLSKKPNFYTRHDQELLARLPLVLAVSVALDYQRRNDLNFRFNLLKELMQERTVKDMAVHLTRRLAEYHKWSHVSIFAVDHVRGRIRMLAEANGAPDGLRLGPDYEQEKSEGLLGKAISGEKLLIVPDVRKEKDYVPGRHQSTTRSEVCYPIRFRDRVRWVLNLEDREANAFAPEEVDALIAIADEFGLLVGRLSDELFLKSAVARNSDAVIRTQSNNRILFANAAACALLGRSEVELREKKLNEYVEGANALLDSANPDESEVVFINAKGEDVPALVSVCPVSQPLPEKLYIAKDMRILKRLQELDFLGEAFYAVAAQTLTPLTLATTWLKRVTNADGFEISETADKVRQQLGKVYLTLQRLKLYDHKEAVQELALVPLSMSAELRSVLEQFPEEEHQEITIRGESPDRDLVRADVYCLGFVVRTILSYLLQLSNRRDTPIDIAVQVRDGRVVTQFTGAAAAQVDVPQADREAVSVRHEIALGEDILKDFMSKMHGSYNKRIGSGQLEFELELPALPEGAMQ